MRASTGTPESTSSSTMTSRLPPLEFCFGTSPIRAEKSDLIGTP